jgi:hypothetical protein
MHVRETSVKVSLVDHTGQDRPSVFKTIASLLARNFEVWRSLGPESAAASRNPLSNASSLWADRKRDTIIPNNRRMIDLMNKHIDVFTPDEVSIVQRFIDHAEGFERNSHERIEDVPTFPKEFQEMISRGQL